MEGVWWGSTSAWIVCGVVFAGIVFFSDWEKEIERAHHGVMMGMKSTDSSSLLQSAEMESIAESAEEEQEEEQERLEKNEITNINEG